MKFENFRNPSSKIFKTYKLQSGFGELSVIIIKESPLMRTAPING